VTARRIWALFKVYDIVMQNHASIEHERLRSYVLTRFFLLYLLAEALSQADEQGRELVRDPASFLEAPRGLERLRVAIGRLLSDLLVDLNAEVKEREESGNAFDYKRELKSPSAVRSLALNLLSSYAKLVKRGRTSSFGRDWEETGSE